MVTNAAPWCTRSKKNGVLNAADARHVAALLDDNSDPLDQIICKQGLVSEDRLAAAYADIFSLTYYPETPKKLRSANATAKGSHIHLLL
jgi:hypothetical protein